MAHNLLIPGENSFWIILKLYITYFGNCTSVCNTVWNIVLVPQQILLKRAILPEQNNAVISEETLGKI